MDLSATSKPEGPDNQEDFSRWVQASFRRRKDEKGEDPSHYTILKEWPVFLSPCRL